MHFMGKLWKTMENIEILNLSQQKEEGFSQYQNQIMELQSFSYIYIYIYIYIYNICKTQKYQ